MRMICGAFVLCTLAVAGSAAAQTPDGTTPANEGVCNGVQGASPGLYGLCVAYCEAQDLDTERKEPPSVKILENYRKRMQPGDPDMPCVRKPCPCWNATELASITDDGFAARCDTNAKEPGIATFIQLIELSKEKNYAMIDLDNLTCRYIDTGTEPDTITGQRITKDEARTCFNQLVTVCNALPPTQR